MDTPHCIVIGAGTVGSCCAWHLVRSGCRVTLVDREQPGQATSYGNAACISPNHVVPYSYPGVWKKLPKWLLNPLGPMTVRWRHLLSVGPWLWKFWRQGTAQEVRRSTEAQVQLMRHVTEDFGDLLARAGLTGYLRSRGLILVYDRHEDFLADKWEFDLEEEYGFEWDYLGPAELRIMVPALDLKQGLALYVPSWQHLTDPGGATAAIAADSFAQGAEWVNEEVRQVGATAERVTVRLSSGRVIEGDRLIIAAGPWSNQLSRQLDGTVPMTAKRGYHSMIGDPGIELDYPVLSGSRVFVITPLSAGIRLAGTAEFARLDSPPDYRRARILQEHARHYLPDLQLREVTEWMGQRPMMVDSVPVISVSPGHANVFYAFGHGHYGLTQGPTTGRLVARMVRGEDPGIDMNPYRFDRFQRR